MATSTIKGQSEIFVRGNLVKTARSSIVLVTEGGTTQGGCRFTGVCLHSGTVAIGVGGGCWGTRGATLFSGSVTLTNGS